MTTYIKRPKLNAKKRDSLAAYFFGEISMEEAATDCGMARQQLPTLTNNIFRALVMEGKIDVIKLLKDF